MSFLPNIEVKIAKNLAKKAKSLVFGLGFEGKRVCFITDEEIWDNCGELFDDNLDCKVAILKNPRPDEKNLQLIRNFLAKNDQKSAKNSIKQNIGIKNDQNLEKKAQNYDLIIAFGSGTINDLCKFISAETGIPYIIFASAPSMNGYLSRNASISIAGHKKTLAATLPLAVYCDLDILKLAPKSMIQAGIGDSLCFYSCWFDWRLSNLILGTKFDEKPFAILQDKMEFFIKNYHRYKLQDDKLLQLLIEILLLSGASMTMAGGSYPASQSEHLIAHAFEMKYPKKAHDIFHGLQIAVTTLTAVKLQEKMLESDFLQIKKSPFLQAKQEKFFGKKVAAECKKEYLAKMSFDADKINASLKKDWKNHRKILQKILLPQKNIKQILQHFKIKNSAKSLGLSSLQYQDLVDNAKFIRNRFSCLDCQ